MFEMDNLSWFLFGLVMTGLCVVGAFLAWLLFPLLSGLLSL